VLLLQPAMLSTTASVIAESPGNIGSRPFRADEKNSSKCLIGLSFSTFFIPLWARSLSGIPDSIGTPVHGPSCAMSKFSQHLAN
jgi:hypothetical protein